MKTLLTVLFTFAFGASGPAAPPNKAAEELDIREATFRYQFEKNASGQQARAGAYYLSISGKDDKPTDPSAEFMKRFAGNKPPVKMMSECNTLGPRVVDKKTGERGLLFETGAIKWIS